MHFSLEQEPLDEFALFCLSFGLGEVKEEEMVSRRKNRKFGDIMSENTD